MSAPSTTSRKGPVEGLVFCGLLALALYGVYFRDCSRMGLYEDDWSALAPYANGSWTETWTQVKAWLTHWPNGRPLGLSTCALAGWGLYKLGGLTALYVLPFTVILACACMIHRILRDSLGALAAFFGAITFALLPTDTLRLSLHAVPQVHVAILFLLLAIRAMQTGRDWAAAPYAFFGLLFHESSTLTTFLAPLLFLTWTKSHLWRTVRYWGYVFAAALSVFCLRIFLFGESRATSAFTSLSVVLERSLISLKTGTLTHWSVIEQRIRETLHFSVPGSLFAFVLVLAIILVVLVWKGRPDNRPAAKGIGTIAPRDVVLFGVLAMSVPYLVYFTDPYWPASHQSGRMASVHSASGVGFSLIVAGLIGFVQFLSLAWLRWTITAAGSVLLAALLAWGNVVRIQHLEAWQNQRTFWTQMVDELGHIQSNSIIFNLRENYWTPPFTWVIASNSWADSIVLRHLYQFPTEWPREPRVFTVVGPWQAEIRMLSGQLIWLMPAGEWAPLDVPLEANNLMIFDNRSGRPVPMDGEIEIAGQRIRLMSPSRGLRPAFKTKPLYNDLIGEPIK